MVEEQNKRNKKAGLRKQELLAPSTRKGRGWLNPVSANLNSSDAKFWDRSGWGKALAKILTPPTGEAGGRTLQ